MFLNTTIFFYIELVIYSMILRYFFSNLFISFAYTYVCNHTFNVFQFIIKIMITNMIFISLIYIKIMSVNTILM